MAFGYMNSWLKEDDEFDRYNKPGSSDWFDLSDDVSFDKPNNRHDALKVESLLGYGGYLDLEKGGGTLGLGNNRLEEPVKAFQGKNGLKVDGLLKPGGPTIRKMKDLYGKAFAGTPAPTPAMMDVQAEQLHQGKDGFMYGAAPMPMPRPNKRLDGKTELFDYERWNRDWARSADDPASYAPEYEGYIRQIEPTHGHDPGLIFARDFAQRVQDIHGTGGAFVKSLLTRLSDRPDLQRAFLGGDVPQHPPQGTFRPGGEAGIKQWIDQDRVANGIAPKYSKAAQEAAPILRTSSGVAPQVPAPDVKNLLEYGPNFGLPGERNTQQRSSEQALPEDGLPPDHVSPHQPTPSQHEDINIDGENNSRRGPTRKEIGEAAETERPRQTDCARLGLQLREALGAFREVRNRHNQLQQEMRDLAAEIARLVDEQGAPPVFAPEAEDAERRRSRPQQTPQTPSGGRISIPRRGGRPSQSPPPSQTVQPPSRNDLAQNAVEAAAFANERQQWEQKGRVIEEKRAQLTQIKSLIEIEGEKTNQANARVLDLEAQRESLGCR